MTGAAASAPWEDSDPTAAGVGSERESLRSVLRPRDTAGDVNDPPEIEISSRGDVEQTSDDHTVALWSRDTAQEIETMLREDLAHGALRATEAAEMIARVWARAEPEAEAEAASDARRLDVTGSGASADAAGTTAMAGIRDSERHRGRPGIASTPR